MMLYVHRSPDLPHHPGAVGEERGVAEGGDGKTGR